MTITIGVWIIPTIISAVLLGVMFRPYQRSGQYDFGELFRLFWLLPLLLVWTIYFGLMLWLKK